MAFGSANTWDQGDVNILVRFQDNGDTLWVKKFYRYSDITIEAVDMVKAVDNSGFFILIVQKKYNYGYFRNSNAILKVNLNGDSLWQKTITPVYEYSQAGLRDIKATPDGGFVVAGANSSLSENLIMKLSPTAEIEWENSTSNADIYPYYANVAVAPDGNYFAVGITSGWHPTGDNDKRLFLRKIDANGNTLWDRSFHSGNINTGDSIRSEGRDVMALADGGCIICGTVSNPGQNHGPALLMCFDMNGEPVWTKHFYNNPGTTTQAHKLHPIASGDFMAYMEEFSSFSNARPQLLKLNSSGDSLWSQHGFDRHFYLRGAANNGGLLFSGGSGDYGILVKTTDDGMYLPPNLNMPWNGQDNVLAPINFGWNVSAAPQRTSSYRLQVATDEAFTNIVVDESNINTTFFELLSLASFTDYYWRTCAFGPEQGYGMWSAPFYFRTGDISSVPEADGRNGFRLGQNYPNPAGEKTTIAFVLPKSDQVKFTITDLCGRTMRRQSAFFAQGDQRVECDISQLPAGAYLYTLETSQGKWSRTMMVYR